MKRIALLLLEGKTEEEFYIELAKLKFSSLPKRIKNLKGNFNINTRIIDAAIAHSKTHADKFDVYVCIDQEKPGTPAFNQNMVLGELRKINNFNELIPVIANLMIESLFFIDIAGIYKHLRTPVARRNVKKYKQFRQFRHQDLSALFRQFGHEYTKGHRCHGFIKSLDLPKISDSADELANMIKKITTK